VNDETNPSSVNKRVLLAVLAHPDDESFGMGGTLALYARRGVNVHLVCATRGEAGEVAPEMLVGFNSVAERRVEELSCAAGILGLAGVHYLDYRDSGMTGSSDNQNPLALCNAPLEEVAEKIAHHVRLLGPQVVLTFDPIGGYKHPDHIAVHRATVRAYQLAGDPAFQDDLPPYQPRKLYLHVFPKRAFHLAVKLMPLFGQDPRRFGRNKDVDLLSLVKEGDFPVHAEIDFREVAEQRAAASACHASQLEGGPPNRGILAWVWRRMGGKEQFMRLYPAVQGKLREKDLFA
jgi:LmbE family N-acetylglucosaminyl deacetylase